MHRTQSMSGDEIDAFSRRSRRIVRRARGEAHRIKTRFSRRARRKERTQRKRRMPG